MGQIEMKKFSGLQVQDSILHAALAGAALLLISGCDFREVSTRPPTAPATSVGTKIDDGIITAKVKSALLADPDVKSFDVKVESRNGEVMLSGFVGNQSQVDRAMQIARGVEGVKLVSNKMDLKDGAASVGNKVDDGIITAKIKSTLLADPGIKSADISVATNKGAVQLSGFVNNQPQIDLAIKLATAVDGVTSVVNEMSIKK